MVRLWLALVTGATLFGQTPAESFRAHCAGCHGPRGQGSRGPSLQVPALKRANDVTGLVLLLRSGIPGTEMPPTAPEALSDARLRELAEYVLGLRTSASNSSATPAGRGADLFRGKGNCAECHRINGEGGTSAPDLSDIGRQRDSAWLRRSISDPESAIYDNFESYRWTIQIPENYLLVEITTANGDQVRGSRMNEDAFSIQIRDANGKVRSFLKGEIAKLDKRWGKSAMPSYRNTLSAAEIDELTAYLGSLRGRQ